MDAFFNPDDWFGRHPNACLVLIAVAILIGGAI